MDSQSNEDAWIQFICMVVKLRVRDIEELVMEGVQDK
jgi:hypothetical protein